MFRKKSDHIYFWDIRVKDDTDLQIINLKLKLNVFKTFALMKKEDSENACLQNLYCLLLKKINITWSAEPRIGTMNVTDTSRI